MKRIFSALKQAVSGGRDSVLVTIVASSGSTPRGAGARMLVLPDGSFVGTIGGGAVEYAALCQAKKLLELKQGGFEGYNLSSDDVGQLGMVCGGRVTVCFQFIPAGDEHMTALSEKALALLDGNEDAWSITDITGDRVNGMGLYTMSAGLWGLELSGAEQLVSGKAYPVELNGKRYYCEPLLKAGRVYVFGGGHVSRELVPTLTRVGFRCVVLDDRDEFLTRDMFPDAEELVRCDLSKISECVSFTENDYIVIMTRGHKYDYDLQAQTLRTPARYIGVIGSKNKVAYVQSKLLADGFSQEEIDRVVSPIGIKIGAETPAEIAVSITAQMIAVRSA